MNHCGIQQSFNNGEPVVCPKPRRFHLNTAVNDPIRVKPLRCQIWFGAPDPEPFGSNSGPELLDFMLPHTGGCYGPPEPFFSGSPPSRVSNPLINDARFKDDKISPISNPSSSFTTYGSKPMVRIEGFNCYDRDNRRVAALA